MDENDIVSYAIIFPFDIEQSSIEIPTFYNIIYNGEFTRKEFDSTIKDIKGLYDYFNKNIAHSIESRPLRVGDIIILNKDSVNNVYFVYSTLEDLDAISFVMAGTIDNTDELDEQGETD